MSIQRIKENSLLAMPIYNESGGVLLNANTPLKDNYLKKLSLMGYTGLYIYDDISDGIYISDILSDKVREKTLRSLKKVNIDACRMMAHSIVDEILKHSNLSIDMVNVASFDNYTYIHSLNVAVLAVIVGIGSDLNYKELQQLSEAALLHDIGKLSISLEVLNKKEKLTDDEMNLIRAHAREGYNMVKDDNMIDQVVKQAILSHHENEDGTGYPQKLTSEQINPYAKIIHVCDVYDALISNRVYRQGMNPADTLEYLMSQCFTMFDSKYVETIMKCVTPYPTGITVELSNKRQAIIAEQNNINYVRPKIKLVDTKEEIDLMKVLNITIVKVLTQ